MLRNILIGLEYKMATARKMVLEPASETSWFYIFVFYPDDGQRPEDN
jgi:hypothetical protein